MTYDTADTINWSEAVSNKDKQDQYAGLSLTVPHLHRSALLTFFCAPKNQIGDLSTVEQFRRDFSITRDTLLDTDWQQIDEY
jgi:hypothetical protein